MIVCFFILNLSSYFVNILFELIYFDDEKKTVYFVEIWDTFNRINIFEITIFYNKINSFHFYKNKDKIKIKKPVKKRPICE